MPRLEVAPLISADCEVPSTEAVLTVIELDFREDPRWEAFVSSHPDALIYHHSGWLSALESEYGQECITLACVDEKGGVCAVLPLFRTKGLPVNFGPLSAERRLSSLPRTPIAGPLATSLESAKAIVQHAVELVRAQPGMQLELKTKIADLDKSVSGLICLPWRPTYTAELPVRTEGAVWEDFWETLRVPRNCVTCKDCRRLRFGNARRQHRVNWSVNKAIKLGLEVARCRKSGRRAGGVVSALSANHASQCCSASAVSLVPESLVVASACRQDAIAPGRAKRRREPYRTEATRGGFHSAAIRTDGLLCIYRLRACGL